MPGENVLLIASGKYGVMLKERLKGLGFDPYLPEDLEPEFALQPLDQEFGEAALGRLEAVLARFAELRVPAQAHLFHGARVGVHPGASRWGELPEFAQACSKYGLWSWTQTPRTLSQLHNRYSFLAKAGEEGIATLLMESSVYSTDREIVDALNQGTLQLPLVLKPTQNLPRVEPLLLQVQDDVESRLALWVEHVRKESRDALLYAEAFREGGRKILLPFCRSFSGALEFFSPVDVSLSLRRRTYLEICGNGGDAHGMREAASQLFSGGNALLKDFYGMGCAQFLVDNERCFLTEVSPRLNHGFLAWEKMDQVDALAHQLAALSGKTAPKRKKVKPSNAVVVWARVFAEDALTQLPHPGEVIEFDTHALLRDAKTSCECIPAVNVGQFLSVDHDGILASFIASGPDLPSALASLRASVDALWVAGSLLSNQRYVADIAAHPWVQSGMFHATFLSDDFVPSLNFTAEQLSVLVGAIDGESEKKSNWIVGIHRVKSSANFPWAWLDEPERGIIQGSQTEQYQFLRGRLRIGAEVWFRISAYRTASQDNNRWYVRMGEWSFSARKMIRSAEGVASINALCPGRVHAIYFKDGANVNAHEPILALECSGVLIFHAAPKALSISRMLVRSGTLVEAGQPLAWVSSTL